MRSRLQPRGLVLVALVVVVSGPVGWVGSDALERSNDFCTACHIDQNVPLHIDIRRDLDRRPARSLAASHAVHMPDARQEDPTMRCIDCHGGVGLVGRARIKLLAARDALVWLSGTAREPTEMRHPLVDADCRQCHQSYAVRVDESAPTAFHELTVHNVDLGMSCVTCHTTHEQGGDAAFYFLKPQDVRSRCAHCHSEFEN
jgi:nitrate/TMAO reductase-like tetraheme cytochrome c subunit